MLDGHGMPIREKDKRHESETKGGIGGSKTGEKKYKKVSTRRIDPARPGPSRSKRSPEDLKVTPIEQTPSRCINTVQNATAAPCRAGDLTRLFQRLTLAIDLTIAQLLIRTIHRFHSKDHMPQELHDPPRHGVVQVRLDHPLPELDVVVARPSVHLALRHGELSAACGSDLCGLAHVFASGQLLLKGGGAVEWRGAGALEDIPPDLLGHVGVEPMSFAAAGIPVTAKVDVAIPFDKVGLKHAHGVDIVVERSVGVPRHVEPGPVGMKEDDGGGESVVMVNDIGQIGHGFMAFVDWGGEDVRIGASFLGGIDDVDGALPTN